VSYQAIIKCYLRTLQKTYNDSLTDMQHTAELSFRPTLDLLFNELAIELNGSVNIAVIFEPRNQAHMGRPDWRIHDKTTLGVYGYIEAKGLALTVFDITPHKEQFDRYLSLGHKLIITDGIDFVYSFANGAEPQILSLIDKSQMNCPDWSSLTVNPQFEIMMRSFYADPSPQFYDEGKLVELVALRTRYLSDEILRYSNIPLDEAMDDTERKAISLLDELRNLVYNHNDQKLRQDKVFADFAAQVIMFALLYAHRVECTDIDSPTEKERKIKEYLSRDIVDGQSLRPFLMIIQYINNYGDNDSFILTWTGECMRFLSFVHMTDQQKQHPDYHKLFELFLSKFDPRSCFDYGTYYTPSELADYIVRLVEKIACNNFDGSSIFSDANTLIDPCCGTGSFLERIRQNDTLHGSFTLCGIEILPAPYMLANYRMAVLNQEIESGRSRNELLLANALCNSAVGKEPVNTDTVEGFELNRVREISSRPITLVIGNPPSSDSFKENIGAEFSTIRELMNDFRPPIEKRHGRQNTQKQINNPFLQFIRFGCELLENSNNHSILAYVVPATFLENESYRYARKYIVEHYSAAWIISVDADTRAGIRSDSIFKARQGRAILIATRRYGETSKMTQYRYFDISRFSRVKKSEWLEQDVETSLRSFSFCDIDTSNYTLHPSLPFDENLYLTYWPISGEAEQNYIFKNHCSGVKLAPSSLFTHPKTPMLKRRSKEIMQNGLQASKEWLAAQDKPPNDEKVLAFVAALKGLGDIKTVDNTLDQNIVDYAFRPFMYTKVLLWQDLLHRYSDVGGGGTRQRPELLKAYADKKTLGIALCHSPKDQNDSLKPFASFCWNFPDYDLCRRGGSLIYSNQYPIRRNSTDLENNINDILCDRLSILLGIGGIDLATEVVFYIYAVLCSQVFLDEFEGALFTVSRSDMRPRIPIVNDAEVFKQLASLGQKVAELEKRDYLPHNVVKYNYDEIKLQVPQNFRLLWTRTIQTFDEDNETITLTDGQTNITIPCPLDAQRLNISGYEVIKNAWMKFNSYDYTHCAFTAEDMEEFLNLINKLIEYVELVGKIDMLMHNIIDGHFSLILPNDDAR